MRPAIALLPFPTRQAGDYPPQWLLAAGIRELWCHPGLRQAYAGTGLEVYPFQIDSSGDRQTLLAAMSRKEGGLLLLPERKVHPLAQEALLGIRREDPARSVLGLYRAMDGPARDGFALDPDGSLHVSVEEQASWMFMGMGLLAAGDIPAVLNYLCGETDRIPTTAEILGCPLPDPAREQEPAHDRDRTLFLDRDGVINHRFLGDYVRRPEDFHFLPGVPEALATLRTRFRRMVIVTNQQGIGKGLMSEADLAAVHRKMVRELEGHGVRLDGIYHCPGLAAEGPLCRKPLPGMALMALRDHPDINFMEAVMVGDTESDMRFGARLGMHTVLIGEGSDLAAESAPDLAIWAHQRINRTPDLTG